MNTLDHKIANASVVNVWFDENKIYVRLIDGRELSVPINWFPRLRDASEEDKNNWCVIGRGTGIHWEAIDEDLSIIGLLRTR